MFTRFKLLVLVAILVLLSTLLIQNQELLSLKLLCSDSTSKYCLYRTPSLPLAIWMVVFILAGMFSSLIWQFLSNLGAATKTNQNVSGGSFPRASTVGNYRQQDDLDLQQPEPSLRQQETIDFRKKNPPSSRIDNEKTTGSLDWEKPNNEDWESENRSNRGQNYEVSKEPQDIRRSGSTYSYKFKEASDSKETVNPTPPKKSTGSSEKTEEIYDANYRTLNNPSPPPPPNNEIEEEDPDWI